MKKNYLLKPLFGKVGWWLLFIGASLLVLTLYEVIPDIYATVFSIIPSPISMDESGSRCFLINNQINDEVATVMIMLALFFIAFSREKDEDEFTDALRLRSWYLTGIIYTIIYIACDLLIYEIAYIHYVWFIQGGLFILIYIIAFKSKLFYSRYKYDGQ